MIVVRIALHNIDNEIIPIPAFPSKEEVKNYKKLADKELYQCPYCHAILKIKYGDIRGMYFSHKHSEACEESRKLDKATTRYYNQIKRELPVHKVMVEFLYDEIKVQSKVYKHIETQYGYIALSNLKEYPDIWLKIKDKEYAVSVITNVNPSLDTSLANKIVKRHKYFQEQGLQPIWFIEMKEQAVEKDKNALILWDAELAISAKTKEDMKWDSLLEELLIDYNFFRFFNYPATSEVTKPDVRSMYYIYEKDENIYIKIQRFLKERIIKPHRAFLLNYGYEIHLGQALTLEHDFYSGNEKLEKKLRYEFVKKYNELKSAFEKQLQKEKLNFERKRKQPQQSIHHKKISTQNYTYNDLKRFLRKKIGMKQSEQMILWNNYILKKGIKNFSLIRDIVIQNDCQTFAELEELLREKTTN